MHHALFRTLLAGSDKTIISYYSHKNSYFGKTFFSKNEVMNDRVYWTDDITENFVTECLIKVQTFFESICGNSQLDGWIIFKKKYVWTVVYQHKNNPWVRYLHAADVRYNLDCWFVWVCLPGAIVTTITSSLVCCKCNRQHRWFDIALIYKYKCWSSASVSDMHAYMHKFTDMTVG